MKGIQQSYGFPNEFITSEIPDSCFPYSNLSVPTVNASQQVNSWPNTNSSNTTIISRIGSPASAFYATEHHMGLSQYDDLHENSSQQFIKSSYQRTPSFQQSGNGFFTDSQARIEPAFPTSNDLSMVIASNSQYIRPEVSYRNPFSNLSESEQLLHLKNKLLSDFDDSDTRSNSARFDQHHELDVSRNLYESNFAQAKQFGRPPGCLSNTSCNNSAAISSRTTRIRWTQDLHDRFVECVNRLGGPDKSTPKAILKLMDTEGLTIFHVKSHLQKYRNAKYVPESLEGKYEKMNSGNNAAEIEIKTSTQIRETLQMQLDVQMRLHEQLEIQRNLQLRIEEQSKQLKMMFDQQQKTTRSLMETNSTNSSKCPNNSSTTTTLEDPEILVLDGSDDDTFFPSKIR